MSSTTKRPWDQLAERVIHGTAVTRADALAILASSDDDILHLLAAAFDIRRHFCGRGVSLHLIRNARSGQCSEDCAYCSQAAGALTGAPRYPLQTADEIVAGARTAAELQAVRYCTVLSGRQPDRQSMDTICDAVRQIKRELPHLQLCVSMGMINADQAARLKTAGVNRYNHNLETSRRFYPRICQTHDFDARLASAAAVKTAGLELCSGGLLGMGETDEDRVELAFALGELRPDSVPVNLLDPRPGTALAGLRRMPAMEALRILAMFRFVMPDREIRVAGGREAVLGPLQPLALFAANSIFTEGYLTTAGQGHAADMAMIAAGGFNVTEIQA